MAFLEVEPGYIRHLQLQGLCTFKDFFLHAGGEVVGGHHSRNVVRVDLGGFHGYLKREYRVHWKDYFSSWWAGTGLVSKSRREWHTLQTLRLRGIDCPQPLAVGEDRGQAFLLVRELPNAIDLCTYLRRGYCPTKSDRRQLARSLGWALAHFHAAGFTHPDLYAKHIFIEPESQLIRLIDFQRTRYRRHVSWRRRWRDLAALDASLNENLASARDRLIFLAGYLKATGARDGRRLWRRALWAIARRTTHLLGRRKIREMRKLPASPDRLETYRIAYHVELVPPSDQAPAENPFHTRGW